MEHYRRIARFFLMPVLLLVMGGLSGCTTFENALPPDVRLADIRFVESGLFEQRFELDLRVRNPNDFDLPIDALTFQLDLNGSSFATGQSDSKFSVPALGETRIPIIASTGILEIIQQMLSMSQGSAFDYRLSGTALVGGLRPRRIPYEKTGSLDLLKAGTGLGHLVPR